MRKCGIKTSIHIKVLELVAIVLKYFAAEAVAFKARTLNWQPRVRNGGDNMLANYWYSKISNMCLQTQKVTRLLAEGCKTTQLSMDIEHYQGNLNYFTNAISRGVPCATMHSNLKKLCHSNTNACLLLFTGQLVCEAAASKALPITARVHFSNKLGPIAKQYYIITNYQRKKVCTFFQGQNISFHCLINWSWTAP